MNTYITLANARKIEYECKTNDSKELYLEDLYKMSLWMLSKTEKKRLALTRMFYSAPEFFINNFYQKTEKDTPESSKFVYISGTPAYHKDSKCEWLTRDYQNFTIPYEIRDRGAKEKERFREWFYLNKKLIEENPKLFLTRMEATFRLTSKPSLTQFKVENSGFTTYDNLPLNDITLKIDNLLSQLKEYRNKNPEIIDKHGQSTHKINELDLDKNSEAQTILENWHNQKQILKRLIKTYYQILFNPDLIFQENLLLTIGFKPCSSCCNPQNAQ